MKTSISFSTALRPLRRRLWAIPLLTLLLGGSLLLMPNITLGNLAFSAFVGFMSLFMVAGYDWKNYHTNQALFLSYWLVVVAELVFVGLPSGSVSSTLPQAQLSGVDGTVFLTYFPAVYMILKIALLQPIWAVWRLSAFYRFNTG